MKDNVTVYIKQPGEPPVPVTVQIEWLPNGKIRPLLYWTPDNSCYEIKRVYESTQLAYLKERGEGIRFRVKAEIKGPIEYDSSCHALHETYLYMADMRFCEKGFVDERYQNASKKYIPVTMDIFEDGDYELVYFWVDDKRYKVEDTIEIAPRGSFFAGGVGLWHKVDARLVNANNDEDPDLNNSIRRMAALFLELNKWFVCVMNVA